MGSHPPWLQPTDISTLNEVYMFSNILVVTYLEIHVASNLTFILCCLTTEMRRFVFFSVHLDYR